MLRLVLEEIEAWYEEIEGSPVITLIGGPADELTIVTPSEAVIGEPFPVLVRAIDSWGNRSDGYSESVTFGASDPLAAARPKCTCSIC